VVSLINPQQGKEQSYGRAYPTNENYIAKEGRRLALLPIRPPQRCRPLYFAVGWGKVRRTPVAAKIRTEASSVPSL
jgi:hypothetical protein